MKVFIPGVKISQHIYPPGYPQCHVICQANLWPFGVNWIALRLIYSTTSVWVQQYDWLRITQVEITKPKVDPKDSCSTQPSFTRLHWKLENGIIFEVKRGGGGINNFLNFGFQLLAKNIKGWLKDCTSYLVYSKICLNFLNSDHPLCDIFLLMIVTLVASQNFLTNHSSNLGQTLRKYLNKTPKKFKRLIIKANIWNFE